MSYSRVFAQQCSYRATVGSILTGLILLAALLITGWVAWRRIHQEPRRLANAGWIAAAVLLSIQTLAFLGFAAPLMGLSVLMFLSPLMAVGLAGFLILNGLVMLRRERFRVGGVDVLLFRRVLLVLPTYRPQSSPGFHHGAGCRGSFWEGHPAAGRAY